MFLFLIFNNFVVFLYFISFFIASIIVLTFKLVFIFIFSIFSLVLVWIFFYVKMSKSFWIKSV